VICRKVAKTIVKREKKRRSGSPRNRVQTYLNVPKFRHGETEAETRSVLPLVLRGLKSGESSWPSRLHNAGNGKADPDREAGDVMQESAQAALTYVRARASTFGLAENFLQGDGTSIFMFRRERFKGRALGRYHDGHIDRLLRSSEKSPRRPRNDGKRSPSGDGSCPSGGSRRSCLRPIAGRFKTVIIPKDNEKDLADVPANVLKNLKIILVDHVDES